jgi:hypothetical protein
MTGNAHLVDTIILIRVAFHEEADTERGWREPTKI